MKVFGNWECCVDRFFAYILLYGAVSGSTTNLIEPCTTVMYLFLLFRRKNGRGAAAAVESQSEAQGCFKRSGFK